MLREAQEAQIVAMLHLETCIGELEDAKKEGRTVDADLLIRRIWAAEYVVQAMNGGPKPENYDEVVSFPEDKIEG